MAELLPLDLAPAEAVRHFESKGYRIGFDWRDVWQEEHAKAFTVAKAMRLDILEDIRREVDGAIRNGTTFETFKGSLKPTLQAKGWWGRADMEDPVTGITRNVQLGSDRRLKTIFDTNLRTSYAAGQWERIERVKAQRPFLRYVAVQDERTRPQHRAWHGTIRQVDDPWWNTHYPPNGWNCRCSVQQLSQRDMDRRGYKVTEDPPSSPPVRRVNRRTGELTEVPAGIDLGWDYNVGKAHLRALAPPPAEGEMFTVFNKPERAGAGGVPTLLNRPAGDVPLPRPTPVPASVVLPKTTDSAQAAEAFFNEFGTTTGRATVFTDVIGERVVIDDALFTDVRGDSKLADSERRQYIRLVALALKQPDEIWWVWEHSQALDRYMLRRRYFKRVEIGGKERSGIVAFDVGDDGWHGVTAFATGKRTYIEKQRGGTLAYRRPDK
jgi:SPP1 gp7 family putative phage head morphogenesis protein